MIEPVLEQVARTSFGIDGLMITARRRSERNFPHRLIASIANFDCHLRTLWRPDAVSHAAEGNKLRALR
jgi:hypothetical protein